jgi:hypothetical protein
MKYRSSDFFVSLTGTADRGEHCQAAGGIAQDTFRDAMPGGSAYKF